MSIFYVALDDNHRPTKVFKHEISKKYEEDELVYEEKDPSFFCSIFLSQTRKYLLIRTADHETSEYYFLNLNNKKTKLNIFQKRKKKIEYDIDHH